MINMPDSRNGCLMLNSLQVCAMHLQHLFTTFRTCNSQPRQLSLLEDSSLMMSFEDGCVHICDPVTALDTAVTLPQLSIRSPRYVRYAD